MIQTSATAQIILDSVQAKYPGNENVKECGPDNHDGFCFDPSLPHRTYRIYLHKENCEGMEGVPCDSNVVTDRWVPINKPIVEEGVKNADRLPLEIRHDNWGIVTGECDAGDSVQSELDTGTKIVMQNCTLTYLLYRKGVTAPPCMENQEKYEDADHQWSCVPKVKQH